MLQRLKVQLRRAYNLVNNYVGVRTGRLDPLLPPSGLHCVGDGDYLEIGEEFFRYFVDIAGLKPQDKVLDMVFRGRSVARTTYAISRSSAGGALCTTTTVCRTPGMLSNTCSTSAGSTRNPCIFSWRSLRPRCSSSSSGWKRPRSPLRYIRVSTARTRSPEARSAVWASGELLVSRAGRKTAAVSAGWRQ